MDTFLVDTYLAIVADDFLVYGGTPRQQARFLRRVRIVARLGGQTMDDVIRSAKADRKEVND